MNEPTEITLRLKIIDRKNLCVIARFTAYFIVKIQPESTSFIRKFTDLLLNLKCAHFGQKDAVRPIVLVLVLVLVETEACPLISCATILDNLL